MNLPLLAYNGAIIPDLDEGFRLADDVTVQLVEGDRGVHIWRTDLPGDRFDCLGDTLLCTIGEDGRLYRLDVFGVLGHLVALREAGHDPVVPLPEVIARFTDG